MWWTNVVRVRTSGAAGSGVFIRPDIVLTAAHVVRASPAVAMPEPTTVVVEQQHGPRVRLIALALALPDGWEDSPAVLDTCAIRVAPLLSAGLSTEADLGADLAPVQVATYGFPGVDPGPGEYLAGTVRRFGSGLESSDLAVPSGLSGAPLLIQRNDHVLVCGVVTARPGPGSTAVTVGLPLLQRNFDELLTKLE